MSGSTASGAATLKLDDGTSITNGNLTIAGEFQRENVRCHRP